MKKPVYIRCPRCELNYIKKQDKFCNVCKKEMKALGSQGAEENLDLDLCPICKVNFIGPDEDMCVTCAKEKALEEGLINESNSDDWDNVKDEDEGIYSEDEETGDMASITELDDDPLDDDTIGIGLDDDALSDLDDDMDEEDDDLDKDIEEDSIDDDLDDDALSDLDDDED